MTVDLLNIGYDPDDDAPPSHCPGPSYDGAHGCGRFLSVGAWMCDRCRAETSAYYQEETAVLAQIVVGAEARMDAYWISNEGQRLIADEQARCFELEDLPF